MMKTLQQLRAVMAERQNETKKMELDIYGIDFCFYNRPQSPLDHCWQRDDCTSKYNWACVALSHAPLCPVDSINRNCNSSARALCAMLLLLISSNDMPHGWLHHTARTVYAGGWGASGCGANMLTTRFKIVTSQSHLYVVPTDDTQYELP